MKAIRTLIIIHPGFEEMEAIAPIDLLKRADIEVCLAGTSEEALVSGRGGITIQTTQPFAEVEENEVYDAVVVPGGPGIKALRNQPEICEFLKKHFENEKIVACICAAPLLLLDAGLLPRRYTAHHTTLSELPSPESNDCVWDGNILTSRGAGTATQFGLALIEKLRDKATRTEVAKSICWPE
ncbi:DJ-1 family protein [Coraliomargarita sinensis]|uniref:DJ-1 family protein n=1 Tax=Coraliomargarita sinensis TaxID=2174842 RepID=A0A317ZK16_9BACT|nr:DJ-1 family glyoxalase III [Coraliomargarita sinensis]PXA04547.1 DJ-1 family protein [Coraliomargarita sinensis]